MPDATRKPRAIIHVDMDAFYASVEVMDNPSLAGRPVIVAGSPESRGVVLAASYEARKFGVHSAMSSYRAHQLCPHGLFIPPRMSRYVEISHGIHAIFEAFTPVIEPISIDEAYLDVTGSQALFGPAPEIGRAIKRRIRDEVGLVASVGVAPNKFLAKLASDLEKPDGFVVIAQEDAQARLAPLPVSRLWGVGKKTEPALHAAGIHTIGDVVRADRATLERLVGSSAAHMQELARGVDDREVIAGAEAKSIGAENTFARDLAGAEELRVELDQLSERVATRARNEGMVGHTVNLKARYADFTTVTRAVTLPEATSESVVIRSAARELLEHRLDRNGRALRLIGVSLSNLSHADTVSGDLFDTPRTTRNRTLDGVMDALRVRFGTKAVRRGAKPDQGR